MKFQLKKTAILLIVILAFTSCSTSDDAQPIVDELEGLTMFTEMVNDTHAIELYSENSGLSQGYNTIKLRIKDKVTNTYIQNAQVSWMPIMHMAMMNHSCPKSEITQMANESNLYEGFIMFQMAQNDTEYWDLKIDYTINNVNYTVSEVIDVPASDKRTVNSFMGTDNVRYVVALIEPNDPKVAVNDMTVGVWKMQDMMTFPVVDGFTVKFDPRMPSMGNHSSPNNVNATQTSAGDLYYGKLSLTMTGYWKISLQLVNAENTVLKGEEITDTVSESSIFFEIEF
ncbi:MAG: hypothetical protein K9I95_12445 [Flavobacteriaceae bacterium]|jgi:hypothetical protein|nr:hypothetical protein [Flavobacteriaceae bacterium]